MAITRAAIALADNGGLEALTMRRLAGELGVATAALYRYFGDREELLAAMTELVLAETPPPPPDLPGWRARMRYEAEQEWQLYRRHPWLLPVLARIRPPLGPGLFDTVERPLAALTELNLSRAELISAYLGYSALVQGLALLWTSERLDRIGAAEFTAGAPAELPELLDPATYPTLHRLFDPRVAPPELDFAVLLGDAVDMLLEGVALRYATGTE
ncbi:TetR/AcrR family transcriptional regulator [Nocardia sp. X0981]